MGSWYLTLYFRKLLGFVTRFLELGLGLLGFASQTTSNDPSTWKGYDHVIVGGGMLVYQPQCFISSHFQAPRVVHSRPACRRIAILQSFLSKLGLGKTTPILALSCTSLTIIYSKEPVLTKSPLTWTKNFKTSIDWAYYSSYVKSES